jgi:HEAT repeat protein
MGLFSRDDRSAEAILRRLETRGYEGIDEKRALLEELRTAEGLKLERVVDLLSSAEPDLARFALESLGPVRDPRLPDLLFQALQKAGGQRGRSILLALQRCPAAALAERMRQLVAGKKVEQRAMVLDLLGVDPRWTEQLHLVKTLLRDEEDRLRLQAVQLLRRDPKDPAVFPLLRELLHVEEDALRHAAIEILAQNPSTDLIEDFFDRIPYEPARLQEVMIRGLGRMATKGGAVAERVLERIMPLLAAEDEQIRAAAAQLLATVPDRLHVLRRFLQYSKGIAFWLRDRGYAAVATVAENLVDAILELLGDPDVDVVVGALVMASKSRDPALAKGIVGVLERDFDWWVKIPALESLAEFPGPVATGALVRALDDEDLACAAMAALAKRGEAATLPRLLGFLDHRKRAFRLAAISAAAAAKDPQATPLLERTARQDPDMECRFRALEALDELGAEGVATAAAVRGEMKRQAPDPSTGVSLTMLPRELD